MKYLLSFSLCCLGFVATSLADAPPVLYLAAPDQFPLQEGAPLLVRELARQSLLMAARDELGLYTRDGLMREWEADAQGNPPADAGGKPALLMNMYVIKDRKVLRVDLFSTGANKTTIDSEPVSAPRENGWVSVPLALENIEPLSRGTYLDQLKKLGYQANVQPKGDNDIPDGVDHLLYQTTLLAPFSALQQVHAAIRESGESPARLSALVRGYANLGQLTRFQWSSIHTVMTARSLLYAQRMVNEDPDSPFALYNRAYAFAMTGLHAAALADLEQARQHEDELSNAGKPVPAIPRWVALLDPFCKYDVKRLAELVPSADSRSPLASLLVFIDVENCASLGELMGIGNAALITDPSCFRIMDGMMVHAGVISGHELTERAPQVMLDILPDDIKLLPVIPKQVQQALSKAHGNEDHVGNLASVTKSFIGCAEMAEPSFTLAGRIIQETNFIHVMRRGIFMADSWGVDSSEYIDSRAPLIADHPFRAYVQSLKLPYGSRGEAMKDMTVNDPQWQMYPMIAHIYATPKVKGKMTGSVAWARIHNIIDATGSDAEQTLESSWTNDKYNLKENAPKVLAISPYSALAAGIIVQTNFNAAAPHLEEWSKKFDGQPAFLSALAQHWLSAKDPDKAVPLLKQLVQVAPDRENIEMLARLYLARGDEDDWLSTMKIVLTQPDYRLDHSYAESEIAWHFMSTGKFDLARNYGDASYNDSASEWSMIVDSFAAEYQGDFDASEKLMMERAQRYNQPLAWYYWCKRTGHGHLEAAQKAADDLLSAAEQGRAGINTLDAANMRYLENQTDAAKKYYTQVMRDQHVCAGALQLAMICIAQKDNDGRDAAFLFGAQQCRKDTSGEEWNCYADYAKLALTANGAAPTAEQVESILKSDHGSPADRTGMYYFMGKQLQLNGDVAGAKKAYQTAIAEPTFGGTTFLLACDGLHQLGEAVTMPKPPEGGWRQ